MNTTIPGVHLTPAQKRTRVGHSYPTKPQKKQPVELSAIANSEEAIMVLNEFMKDARKEIRKRETLRMTNKQHRTDCDEVTFYSDSFSLTINFTEGLRV